MLFLKLRYGLNLVLKLILFLCICGGKSLTEDYFFIFNGKMFSESFNLYRVLRKCVDFDLRLPVFIYNRKNWNSSTLEVTVRMMPLSDVSQTAPSSALSKSFCLK